MVFNFSGGGRREVNSNLHVPRVGEEVIIDEVSYEVSLVEYEYKPLGTENSPLLLHEIFVQLQRSDGVITGGGQKPFVPIDHLGELKNLTKRVEALEIETMQALVGDLSSALGAVKKWTNDKDTWVGEGHGWHFIAILYLSGCECTATKNGTVVRLPPELRLRARDSINKQQE